MIEISKEKADPAGYHQQLLLYFSVPPSTQILQTLCIRPIKGAFYFENFYLLIYHLAYNIYIWIRSRVLTRVRSRAHSCGHIYIPLYDGALYNIVRYIWIKVIDIIDFDKN